MKQESITDSVFIIDNNNVNHIQSHLYGFTFVNNTAYVNCDLPENIVITNNLPGAYIAIVNDGNKLSIIQDSLSTFYIFVYKCEDYFCLSNSFYTLCEHVKEKYPLSLNDTYVHQYLSTPMAPLTTKNTLANEISIIPLFSKISIDKIKCTLSIEDYEVHFGDLDIDSDEGMNCIDGWISKWGTFIAAIALKERFPMRIDLTGGYDSRTIFSLACGAGLDFNASNINVFSKVPVTAGQQAAYGEDLKIAKQISEMLAFTLNNNGNILNNIRVSGCYSYEIFKTAFMGFHKEGYFEPNVHNSVFFHLGGFNGEPVRGKVRSLEMWFKMFKSPCGVNPNVYKELLSDYQQQRNKSNSEYEALRKLYLGSWGRNHYGQTIFRDLLVGRITLSPFSDLDLFRLKFPENIGHDAIFALIIQRTCSKLLTLPFAGKSDFSVQTKKYVKYLDEKYRSSAKCGSIAKIDLHEFKKIRPIPDKENFPDGDGTHYLYSIFSDKRYKELFFEYCGSYAKEIYEYANCFYNDKEHNVFYNQWCVVVTAIMEFLYIAHGKKSLDLIDDFEKLSLKYNNIPKLKNIVADLQVNTTARFDIKNTGDKDNGVIILTTSDKGAVIDYPKWYANEQGIGCIVHSTNRKLKLQLKCINDGILHITLRGKDFRDKNNRIPIIIHYINFTVDNIAVINKTVKIWHDKPFVYTKTVANGDIVTFYAEWE